MTQFSTEKNNKMIFLTPMVIFSGTALFGQMTFDRLLCEEVKVLLLLLLLLWLLFLFFAVVVVSFKSVECSNYVSIQVAAAKQKVKGSNPCFMKVFSRTTDVQKWPKL